MPEAPILPWPRILRQNWLNLSFLHWAVEPLSIAHLYPPDTEPVTLTFSDGLAARFGPAVRSTTPRAVRPPLQRRVQRDRVVAQRGRRRANPRSGGSGTTLLSPPANNSPPEPRSVSSGISSEANSTAGTTPRSARSHLGFVLDGLRAEGRRANY